jgi:hypothetical protein
MPVAFVGGGSFIASGTSRFALRRFRALGICIRSSHPKALLKPPLGALEPVQGIEQLKTNLTHLVRARRVLLGLSNGKPDSVNRHARLIREFVVNDPRTRLSLGVNHPQNLVHHLRRHEPSASGLSPLNFDLLVHRLRAMREYESIVRDTEDDGDS